jgi:2-C-methyl-D-erythritol 4-phosphate cytidylyltransferase
MAIPATAVILAAGGRGHRLGGGLPKALVPLRGRPLFLHSLRAFARLPFVREIVVVLPAGWIERVRRAHARELLRLRVSMLVPGGPRRQDSVRAGLSVVKSPIVLVHDAARPLVTARQARAVAVATARHGAAVLASPAVDTVKIVDARGRVRQTPDRSRVWHAETPQGFRREILLRAYRTHGRAPATDDAALVERAGGRVVIVPSDGANFKVTTRDDLRRVKKFLDRA